MRRWLPGTFYAHAAPRFSLARASAHFDATLSAFCSRAEPPASTRRGGGRETPGDSEETRAGPVQVGAGDPSGEATHAPGRTGDERRAVAHADEQPESHALLGLDFLLAEVSEILGDLERF